jgi:hypothetical protein
MYGVQLGVYVSWKGLRDIYLYTQDSALTYDVR